MNPKNRILSALALTGGLCTLSWVSPAEAENCPSPTKKMCLKKGYLESSCGQKNKQLCKGPITDGLEAQFEASKAPKRKMFKPGGSSIPKDLQVGKYHRYKGPKTPSRALNKKGKNAFAQQQQSFVPGPAPRLLPLNAHRSPEWEDNGNYVASCREYAYEKLYGWTRFMDASAACKGNPRCVVDVGTRKSVPGLDRQLTSRDGKDKLAQEGPTKGVYPKNVFFTYGEKFVYAEGPKGVAEDPKWDALAAVMKKGELYHYIGSTQKPPNASEGKYFKDQFAFHRAMREATKKVSDAEFEELRKRRELMAELLSMWYLAVQAEASSNQPDLSIPLLQHELELPHQTQVLDPLQSLLEGKKRKKIAKGIASKLQKKIGAQGLSSRPGAGWISRPVSGQTSMRSVEEIDAELSSVLAAPARRTRSPWKQRRRTKGRAPARTRGKTRGRGKPGTSKRRAEGAPSSKMVSVEDAYAKHAEPHLADLPCAGIQFDAFVWYAPGTKPVYGKDNKPPIETLGFGPISCRIGTLLRYEWERHLAGEVSCVDPNDPTCDWEPSTFAQRYAVDRKMLQKYYDLEQECTEWAGPTLAHAEMPASAVTQTIKNTKFAVKKAKGALGEYHKGKNDKSFNVYGDEWSDSESWGDKGTFGSKYTASAEWNVEAKGKNNAGQICAFEGDAQTKLLIKGFVAGFTVDVVDALASVESTPGGATMDAHLLVVGKALFGAKSDYKLSKAWGPKTYGKTKTVPTPKPVIPLPTGPVPASASAWIELFMGASISADGNAGTCANGGDLLVEVTAGPEVRVNGRAQVGVGIAGLVSAGIRGKLNLVRLGLPFRVALERVGYAIQFSSGLDMLLSTLSGSISLYVEYIIGEEEFELFSWNGLGPETITLLELEPVSMPMAGFDK